RPGLTHTYPEIHTSASSIPESSQQLLFPYPDTSPIFPQPNPHYHADPHPTVHAQPRHDMQVLPHLLCISKMSTMRQNMWDRYEVSGWQKTPKTISLSRKKGRLRGGLRHDFATTRLFGNFQGCIGVNDRVWCWFPTYRSRQCKFQEKAEKRKTQTTQHQSGTTMPLQISFEAVQKEQKWKGLTWPIRLSVNSGNWITKTERAS
ncbi:hypothetical protein GGP41_004201, partial [Bipolaris sorokiniana]